MKKYLLIIIPLFASLNSLASGGSGGGGESSSGNMYSQHSNIFGLGGSEFLIVLLVLFIFLIPLMYLATLRNTLKLTTQKNRTIQPSNVWLYLIPIVGIFVHVGMVLKITETLKKEFTARGLRYSDSDFGKGVGLTFSILNIFILSIGLFNLWQLFIDTSNSNQTSGDAIFETQSKHSVIQISPLLINLFNLVSIICWIVYWVKISNCKKILIQSSSQTFQNPNSNIGFQNGVKPSENPNGNTLDDLKKLGDLFQSGVLTKEEFEKKKAEILYPKK